MANAIHDFIENALLACAWRQHNHTRSVVGPATFQQHMQPASSFFAKMNIGESGRVVAGVRTIKKRITHNALAKKRFGICASNRIISFRKHVARHEHIGTRFKADPACSRILTNGDAIALSDFRIFEKLVKNEGATRFALRLSGFRKRAFHVARKHASDIRDGLIHGFRHGLFCNEFRSIHKDKYSPHPSNKLRRIRAI